MAEVARIRWRTSPPTSIDELLVVSDDGTATLVVRTPRDAGPTIGSYVARPAAGDLSQLAAAAGAAGAGGQLDLDLLLPDGGNPHLWTVAERVATQARATPLATLTFRAHAAPAGGSVTLLAVAAGDRPADFVLDPARLVLHAFDAEGQPLGWQPLPAPQIGFVDRDARGLGGLRVPTSIGPGAFGAIVFDVAPPSASASVAIGVTGTLRAPIESTGSRCDVRTEPAPVHT